MNKNYFLITIILIIIISAAVLRIKQVINNGIVPNYSENNNSFVVENNSNKDVIVGERDEIEEDEDLEPLESEEIIMPGSDRDSHGCIASAGYGWCESKEKCLRVWEEDCPLEIEGAQSVKAPVEVVVSYPLPGDIITSPLEVTGRALGKWFFEAVIPLSLVTEEGEEIVRHYGEAESNWMSEDFVPFSGVLEFTTSASRGYLIVERDNPSGLPEHDAQISIPVKFK